MVESGAKLSLARERQIALSDKEAGRQPDRKRSFFSVQPTL
jgi:hypothetical protein